MTTPHSEKTELEAVGGWIAREWKRGFYDRSTM